MMRIALVGHPNCGKTALFNRLTGARQKVANYAGVTVERKEGTFRSEAREYTVVDLPGIYGLESTSPDEVVTRQVLMDARDGARIDAVVMVIDATNMEPGLRLALEVQALGLPMVVALNMADVARERGIRLDEKALGSQLGATVVQVVAIEPHGADRLIAALDALEQAPRAIAHSVTPASAEERHRAARALAQRATLDAGRPETVSDRIDAVILHPVLGYAILATVLFLVFQAVFSWSKVPMDLVKDVVDWTADGLRGLMPEGPLRSLLVDGVVVGVGSVLVFLPQILVLFLFILALEDSGYLPRAAFLLDRMMSKVGLSGRAFIPLLSSFACAVPGIMATRTIPGSRERMAAIMVAPLMTCSARLPVYALIIGAFVPDQDVGVFNLRGIVLFSLYLAGIVSAIGVAALMKHFGAERSHEALLFELPRYHWPHLRSLAIGLWERARIFLTRAGTIILSLTILLWFLASYPAPPAGATGPAIEYSAAGRIGAALSHVLTPIGFNWQIAVALVPGLAAREVVVGALATVYALSATGDNAAAALAPVVAAAWTLPTALALLAWYVFAPQCIATLSIVRRETNRWTPVAVMAVYMFALAYIAAFATYRIALALTA
jgi:ferrous iron transport protein B